MKYQVFTACLTLAFVSACNSGGGDTGGGGATASLGEAPTLSGTIEGWTPGKTGILKVRMAKKSSTAPGGIDNSIIVGEFNVNSQGSFTAKLPSSSQTSGQLDFASNAASIFGSVCSTPTISPFDTGIAFAYLDLFASNGSLSGVQVIQANNNTLQKYQAANLPVGSKHSVYLYSNKEATVQSVCNFLLYGSARIDVHLKIGWNLVTIEVKTRVGISGAYDVVTNGVPSDLKWFMFGNTSNIPTL
jgi:hypothetical protein